MDPVKKTLVISLESPPAFANFIARTVPLQSFPGMQSSQSRRKFIATSGALASTALIAGCASETKTSKAMPSFRYCLNTSTIREKNIGIEAEVDVAALRPRCRPIADYQSLPSTPRDRPRIKIPSRRLPKCKTHSART